MVPGRHRVDGGLYVSLMLAGLLSDAGVFQDDPFRAIDVGCSGGILPLFKEFAPDVVAVGIDPLCSEIERLSTTSGGWDQYVCARVGTRDWSPVTRDTPGVYERSSAHHYSEVARYDHVAEYYNAGSPVRVSEDLVGIDAVVSQHLLGQLDFLKSDTDGYELGVLRSGTNSLRDVLGVFVEVTFDAPPHRDANSFTTISGELEGAGLRLFDLSAYRYSKKAFPMPFVHDIPAQTISGQVFFGDALFCRDLAVLGRIDPVPALKLACIHDYFGLQDCAVELLERPEVRRQIGKETFDESLECLRVRSASGEHPNAARERFSRSPRSFFPSSESRLSGETGHTSQDPIADRVSSHVQPPRIGAGIELGAQSEAFPNLLIDGWNPVEPHGAWTSAFEARVAIRAGELISHHGCVILTLGAPGSAEQSSPVAVELDGPVIRRTSATVSGWGQSITVPLTRPIAEDEVIEIALSASPLRVPRIEGWSKDSRQLGVSLMAVRLVDEAEG